MWIFGLIIVFDGIVVEMDFFYLMFLFVLYEEIVREINRYVDLE